jgi:spore coat polysaccharide biosynthesis protein SpsF (cytidylyltransferase family)
MSAGISPAVVILQARMASTRLPGKAAAFIGARTLLGHGLARLRIGGAAPVLLATTTNREDDVLVAMAAKYGVATFRGPVDDVLGRYILAAQSVGARYIVRATGDNPAIDIGGPGRVLAALRSTNADHVIEDGLPYGSAVEAVTLDALIRASALATSAADREHVTPLIRRAADSFTALKIPAPLQVRRPDVRVTVDTLDDLHFMRDIAARMNNWSSEPELRRILAVAASMSAGAQCA